MELAEDFVFVIIREGGILVYVYPEMGDKTNILSVLLHAITSVSDILSEGNERITLSIGNKKLLVKRVNNYLYGFFFSDSFGECKAKKLFDNLVSAVSGVLNKELIFVSDYTSILNTIMLEKLGELVEESINDEITWESILILNTGMLNLQLIRDIHTDPCIELITYIDGRRNLQEIVIENNLDDQKALECARKFYSLGLIKKMPKVGLFSKVAIDYINMMITLSLYLVDKEAILMRIIDYIPKESSIYINPEMMMVHSLIVENTMIFSIANHSAEAMELLENEWKALNKLLLDVFKMIIEYFTVEGSIRVIETINNELRDKYGSIINDFLEESGVFELLESIGLRNETSIG